MMRHLPFRLLNILLMVSLHTHAQHTSLRQELQGIIRAIDGNVGVAVKHVEKGDTLMILGSHHFPMQSVFKFPLAMAVLHEVDLGKLSLSQKVHIKKEELHKNTWSPMAEKYPEGNVDLTLEEILRYTVSQSDNNGCDILFRLIGGTAKVDAYIHSLGVKDIEITKTEDEMSKGWDVQFLNWSTPFAMAQLLDIVQQQRALSPDSNVLLIQLMTETYLGPNRIRIALPEGTSLAHRTGTGDSNNEGITGAINDVGIITLPDGGHLVIVVFISRTSADPKKAEGIIAAIARTCLLKFPKKS